VDDPSYSSAQGGRMFTDFAVFGYVEGAVLLDGVRVAKDGAGMNANNYAGQTSTAWKYEGTQYWIAGANYNFNAVAPKTNGGWEVVKKDAGNNVVTDATKTTISFTNNGTTDLLYATAAQEGKNKDNDEVKFNFRHVLSKGKFSFENAYNASNAKIRVKDVKILDTYTSGVATLNANTAWVPTANSNNLTLNFGNAAVASATAEEPFGNGTTVESYNELLMIPGAGATAYKVKDANGNEVDKTGYTVKFTVELLVSNTKVAEYLHTIYTDFAPVAGHSYDLKATITPENIDPAHSQEAIQFTVNTIGGWANGNTADDATDNDSNSTTLN
jgi:hypothetical protein